jgi:hypothetical protein
MNDQYTEDGVDANTVQDEPEEVGSVQSPDYTTKELTPPGKYVSESRKIEYKGRSTGKLNDATARAAGIKGNTVFVDSWQITLSGLVDRATGRTFRRPDFFWLTSRPRQERIFGTQEFRPGFTTDVRDYLIACGYPTEMVKNLKGLEAIQSALDESQSRPVGVTTGLEPKGKENGQTKANGKKFYRTPGNPQVGVYEKTADGKSKTVYTSAFKDPEKEGAYLTKITVDGEEWEASEKIERFHRLGA